MRPLPLLLLAIFPLGVAACQNGDSPPAPDPPQIVGLLRQCGVRANLGDGNGWTVYWQGQSCGNDGLRSPDVILAAIQERYQVTVRDSQVGEIYEVSVPEECFTQLAVGQIWPNQSPACAVAAGNDAPDGYARN